MTCVSASCVLRPPLAFGDRGSPLRRAWAGRTDDVGCAASTSSTTPRSGVGPRLRAVSYNCVCDLRYWRLRGSLRAERGSRVSPRNSQSPQRPVPTAGTPRNRSVFERQGLAEIASVASESRAAHELGDSSKNAATLEEAKAL